MGIQSTNIPDEPVEDNLLSQSVVSNQYVEGQWVVKFTTKKKINHLIGCIEEVVFEDEINVKYVKTTEHKTYLLTWPENEEISEVQSEDIVKVLTESMELRRGILKCTEDLRSYT